VKFVKRWTSAGVNRHGVTAALQAKGSNHNYYTVNASLKTVHHGSERQSKQAVDS